MHAPIEVINTVQEGSLLVYTNGKWKKRWAVLGRKSLALYAKPKDVSSLVEIPLREASVSSLPSSAGVVPPKKTANQYFEVTNDLKTVTHSLMATIPSEQSLWVERITRAIDALRMESSLKDGPEKDDDAPSPRPEHKSMQVPDASIPHPAVVQLKSRRVRSKSAQMAAGHVVHVSSTPLGPAPPRTAKPPGTKESKIFSFTGEQLLIAYRFMKKKVEEQETPLVIHIPPNDIYRRFGFGLAIHKLRKMFPTLTTIRFDDCKFGGDFFMEFKEVLSKNPSIHKVIFCNSSGACDDVVHVLRDPPPTLTHISFENVFTKKGVDLLSSTLAYALASSPAKPEVETLSKSASAGGGEEYRLKSLEMYKNTIKDYQVSKLAETNLFACIDDLTLDHANLGDTGAIVLFDALSIHEARIRHLSLAGNHIGKSSIDSVVQFVYANSSLTSLNLSNNNLGDSVESIFIASTSTGRRPNKLRELNLAKNNVRHASCYTLSKLLQYNKTLTHLDLSNNRFKEESGDVILVCLPLNKHLVHFDVSGPSGVFGTAISSKQLRAMAEILARNRTIASQRPSDAAHDTQRTPGGAALDYACVMAHTLAQLGLNPPSFAALHQNSTEFAKAHALAHACHTNYAAHAVDAYIADADVAPVVGGGEPFIRHIAYMLYLTSEVRRRMKRLSVSGPTLEGYLFKRGARRRNWRRRWFVLNGLFIFYYVSQANQKRKGVIVLEEAEIVEEATSKGITPYSFEIVTPGRRYVLSCDVEETRQKWLKALNMVKTNQKKRNLSVQLDQIKHAVESFQSLYVRMRMDFPDPHREHVLQWWFPQALEVLCTVYLATTHRHASSTHAHHDEPLMAMFVQNSAIAMYLLTGEYLYDAVLFRTAQGTDQALLHASYEKAAATLHNQFTQLKAQLVSVFDEWPDTAQIISITRRRGLKAGGGAGRKAPSGQKKIPVAVVNALNQSVDLRSVLIPLLNQLDNDTLALLLTQRQSIPRSVSRESWKDASSEFGGSDVSSSTRTMMEKPPPAWSQYEYLPAPETVVLDVSFDEHFKAFCDEVDSTDFAFTHTKELLLLLKHSHGLSLVEKPLRTFLSYAAWCYLHWPALAEDSTSAKRLVGGVQRAAASRLVFIMAHHHRVLVECRIAMPSFAAHSRWSMAMEYVEDMLALLVVSARVGFSSSSVRCVREPLESVVASIIAAVAHTLARYAELQCDTLNMSSTPQYRRKAAIPPFIPPT